MAAVGPWYPMYGNDFDSSTDTWDLASVGAYVRLLNHQWDKGAVPDDERKVGAILRVGPTVARRLWWIVTDKFPVDDDGQRRNPRMAEIRTDREAFMAAQGRKAKAGGAARWHARGHSHGNGSGIEKGPFSDARTYASPSSSPSSSPSKTHTDPDPERARVLREREQSAEADFERIWETYPEQGRKAKDMARRAWLSKLEFAPPIAEVLMAIIRQKKSEQWAKRAAIPNLERWITEARWTDAVAAPGDGAAARYRRID